MATKTEYDDMGGLSQEDIDRLLNQVNSSEGNEKENTRTNLNESDSLLEEGDLGLDIDELLAQSSDEIDMSELETISKEDPFSMETEHNETEEDIKDATGYENVGQEDGLPTEEHNASEYGLTDEEFTGYDEKAMEGLEDVVLDERDWEAPEAPEEATEGPSTMSDVFSDALSAISDLEDEQIPTKDGIQEGISDSAQTSSEVSEDKKISFLQKLIQKFTKKKKNEEDKSNEASEIKNEEGNKKSKNASKKAKNKEKPKKEKVKKAAKPKKKAAPKKDKKKATKPKKAPKPKEKKQREVELELEDTGKVNKVAASLVFVVFASVTVFVIIVTSNFVYGQRISTADRKFNHHKYNQAYDKIAGVKVKEDDAELYDKIMTVMYVNKQLNSYNYNMALKRYPEALDSLIKGLDRYQKYIDIAKKLGIKDDLDYVREQILAQLKKTFHLSEKKAMDLMNIEDQTKYSIKIYDIVLENDDLKTE